VNATSCVIVTADDYGYAPSYDEGIIEAAGAGAVDAVGVMVGRRPDPSPLLGAPVDIGVHLEGGEAVVDQLTAFERLFGGPPAFIDGHKHWHSTPRVADEVAAFAARGGIPVRSVDPRHRRMLRAAGVATPDLLVGRIAENEPPIPPPIAAALAGEPPARVIEWMTHPGFAGGPSAYDAGREEDLAIVIALGDRGAWETLGITRIGPSALG